MEIRKGKQYIKIDKSLFTLNYENGYIELTNLFNDKALSDNMNIFLNANSNVILEELKPGMAETLRQIADSVINNVLNKFPYHELFLTSD